MKRFPCTIMRGGTSKAIFFLEKDMPADKAQWEPFLLDVMGSPDQRQIDGLGGGNSLTSKVAIIKTSKKEGYDVDYTFAQVSLNQNNVDFKGNCGNISSAVGPCAYDMGLVKAVGERANVAIYNTNTDKRIESDIAINEVGYNPSGTCIIPGVPNPGSEGLLTFYQPEGAVTGQLLPTGNTIDIIKTTRGKVKISIVDAANPLVFVRAESIGCTGTELHFEFVQADLDYFEEIRSIAAELCGFCRKEEATDLSPAVPKMTLIDGPKVYKDASGRLCKAQDMDMVIRMMSMQKPHQALAITGAVCTATAANTMGTIVNEVVGGKGLNLIRMGHPGGIMNVTYSDDAKLGINVGVQRTARKIMEGFVYTRNDY